MIFKEANDEYYMRNRSRIRAKQRAYRQQNASRIRLQQARYRARVKRGQQIQRRRTTVGNSYMFSGGMKFASIPGVKGLKMPRIATPRPAVMGTKLQPISMGGNNRAFMGLSKSSPMDASLRTQGSPLSLLG